MVALFNMQQVYRINYNSNKMLQIMSKLSKYYMYKIYFFLSCKFVVQFLYIGIINIIMECLLVYNLQKVYNKIIEDLENIY